MNAQFVSAGHSMARADKNKTIIPDFGYHYCHTSANIPLA
jgi:hypothetical protein